MFWLFLGVLLLIAAVGMVIGRKVGITALDGKGPALANKLVLVASLGFLSLGAFDKILFYAEPGYVYHVRTIFGEEKVIDDVGYNTYWFGRIDNWKKAMTVQIIDNREGNAGSTSAVLPPKNIMFLDQVDANVSATVRFRIPTDRETFLTMAHEYRTPANLLRTALIPSVEETLSASGNQMSAEDYYSGGRTEFNNDFEIQMKDGIYIVKRKEVLRKTVGKRKGTANASKGNNQEGFGDEQKTVFVVERMLGTDGLPLRKAQKFLTFGIQVVEARITDMKPNVKFVERMQLKQKASADRAIAREQRVQEEEQRLLAIAKGEREVAQRQAKAKVEQIEKTTKAETEKQLAITNASRQLEQAKIEKQTAAQQLERDRIKAKSVKVLADAEAYKKSEILKADNALQQKLDAYVKVQQAYADAFAKRKVPTTVFGTNGKGSPGSDSDIQTFLNIQTMKASRDLNLDVGIKKGK